CKAIPARNVDDAGRLHQPPHEHEGNSVNRQQRLPGSFSPPLLTPLQIKLLPCCTRMHECDGASAVCQGHISTDDDSMDGSCGRICVEAAGSFVAAACMQRA